MIVVHRLGTKNCFLYRDKGTKRMIPAQILKARQLARAQTGLGWMYQKGQGVPQDSKAAVKWYKLAAEQGFAFAQYNLGRAYAKGQGVIQDNVYAHMWFNIAASSGESKNASKNRDLAAKRMTPSQLETAQKLARECVAKKYKGC